MLKRHARHYADRRADPRRADRAAARARATSTRATRPCATPRRRWSTWRCTRCTSSEPVDVVAFERAELERIGLPAGVGMNHRLAHFQHLFSGSGYAAGYYVYLWAEVLDADGFDAFVEAGDPFDAGGRARACARFIYSSRQLLEPGAAYRGFRGRAADVEPMLRQRGLLEPERGRAMPAMLGAARRRRVPGTARRSAAMKTREVDRLGPVVGEAGARGRARCPRASRWPTARCTGSRAVLGSARSRRSTSKPSKSGSCMSTSTRSGRSARARATPARAVGSRDDRQAADGCATSSSTSSTLTGLSSM